VIVLERPWWHSSTTTHLIVLEDTFLQNIFPLLIESSSTNEDPDHLNCAGTRTFLSSNRFVARVLNLQSGFSNCFKGFEATIFLTSPGPRAPGRPGPWPGQAFHSGWQLSGFWPAATSRRGAGAVAGPCPAPSHWHGLSGPIYILFMSDNLVNL
jgi:hypothetical protein